ncbi:unnamed protein product [Candidula unifasciata]|uniref:Caffeoyl-CoA O-methyltransferase n=1 Tax=Candidula unifasciata TaxID=100452 RepID=A0A8S3ZD95_9EUPU|nr:unnamed protein product [Candidula unifasciata]
MWKHISSNYNPAILEVQKALQLATSSGASLELIQTLQSALALADQREEFAHTSTSKQSQTLKEIQEETLWHDWTKAYEEGKTAWQLRPGMLSGPLEGQFLKSLVSMQKAKRILEIGMFTGYGALAMAEALPADGEVVTVDMTEYLKPLVTNLIKSSPHHKKIKIVIGKAREVLLEMSHRKEKFDIIFLDADKSEYTAYFKIIFEGGLLGTGGTVLVDNAFRRGEAYIPALGDTPSKQFAKFVSSDASLHKVLVPIRDGVLIIRRLSDVEGSVA